MRLQDIYYLLYKKTKTELNSEFSKEGEETLVIVAVRLLLELVKRAEVDSVELHVLWFVCDVKKHNVSRLSK